MNPALFPIRDVFVRRAPEITIARGALGILVFLDDPVLWAKKAAPAALRAFLQRKVASELKWFTTSMVSHWTRLGTNELPKLSEALAGHWTDQRVRHLFRFRVVDDTGAPRVGFSYGEIDSRRARRCGYIEITLPFDTDPQELSSIALELASLGPIVSGLAGYTCSWNSVEPWTAYPQVYPLCARFLGLEFHDPDSLSWFALDGLPGTNWLTMIGDSLAATLDIDLKALQSTRWTSPVETLRAGACSIIRAGTEPTLGDVNRLVYPSAYAEVARTLAPYFTPEMPDYWTRYGVDKSVNGWLRRFAEPKGWR